MAKPIKGVRLEQDEKSGRWYIWWQGKTSAGKPHPQRRSTGTTDLGEAEKVRAGFILEQERQGQRETCPTVADCLDYYEKNKIDELVVENNRVRARLTLVNPRAFLGHIFIDELTDDDAIQYKYWRRANRSARNVGKKRFNKPIADATIRRELATCFAAINLTVKKKKLNSKWKAQLELPPQGRPRERALKFGGDEDTRLLNAAQQRRLDATPRRHLSRTFLFIAIALHTASRSMAIRELQWAQVDFTGKKPQIDFRRQDGSAETNKRRGIVKMSPWLLGVMKRAYRERKDDGCVLGHMGPVQESFRLACRKAGLGDDVTPHTLRHTWATWAAMRGVPMYEIAAVMFCSVQTATKNYIKYDPDHQARAVDGMPSPDTAAMNELFKDAAE